jgi:hypothetical protein
MGERKGVCARCARLGLRIAGRALIFLLPTTRRPARSKRAVGYVNFWPGKASFFNTWKYINITDKGIIFIFKWSPK